MATLEFNAPLPNELLKLSVTWVRGKGDKPTPTDEASADGAIVERTTKVGLKNTARATIDEAHALLDEVEKLQGRFSRQTTRPKSTPTTRPRTPSTTRPPTTSTTTRAPSTRAGGSSRSVCPRCDVARDLVGPRHVLSVEDLDGFSRRGLDGAQVVCNTVYEYECPTCHSLESFATAR